MPTIREHVLSVARAAERRITGAGLYARARRFRRELEIHPRSDLLTLGSNYGFWVVPDTFDENSVCYLAGVGEDISFDLALVARYGCTIHSFDPVPAAAAYAGVAARHEPRVVFHQVGLWSADMRIGFHGPEQRGHVSHSATDLHGRDVVFEADVRSVRSLMEELGHTRLDLLKLSVEGAEYEIVRGTLADGVHPSVVCIEYAQPAPRGAADETHDLLIRADYSVVAARIRPRSWKLTYMHAVALER
jgi:FkbM family methyltransferase